MNRLAPRGLHRERAPSFKLCERIEVGRSKPRGARVGRLGAFVPTNAPHCRPLRPGIREAAHGQSRQSDGLRRADAPGAALARGGDGRPVCRGSMALLRRAARLSAGRDGQDHVSACAGGLDGDLRLCRHDRGRARHAGLAPSACRRGAEGRGAARRGFHLHLPRHRLALGQADVGDLLGVGRPPDFGAGAVHSLSRPHRALARDRRSGPRGQSGGDPDARRRGRSADHQILGRLVEHAASAGVGVPARRADDRARTADGP